MDPLTDPVDPLTDPVDPLTDPVDPLTDPADPLTDPVDPLVALTGGTVSPPIDATAALVGRDRTLERIDRAIEWSQRPPA